uniref:hypothetical protein n=1 Tax=Carboxylicivirga fragile TaxID=3417571 RepID=UPI003D3416DA|nr:hypothetical protein [Marinilabiliaceae bacterium N1Y90]
EVKVKNKRTDTYTVSIDKWTMGTIKDWMSFSTENIAIQPSKTATFQYTIKVPSYATEGQINI